jgi:uncharacterized membrane protein
MATEPTSGGHPSHRNIRAIVELERSEQQRKSFGDAIGERIARTAGRVSFLILNLSVLAAWAVWNAYAPIAYRFDPYPFGLLTFFVSLEGLFIALFVLMAQNRMSQQVDKRDHLHLQIALLTEQELTLALHMLRRLTQRLDIPTEGIEKAHDERFYEETDVSKLMETLERALPDKGAGRDDTGQG